jgi:hypothetical protein
MKNLVIHMDNLLSNHDEMVFDAFRLTRSPESIFGTVHIDYGWTEGSDGTYYKTASESLIGFASAINWSFSELIYTDKYNYSKDDVVKKGFLENTAFTVSAGNNSGCGSSTNWPVFFVRSKDDIPEGMYQLPAFDRIDFTASSPYDFTVGSIKTFQWNIDNVVVNNPQSRATKDAVFDIACFSEVAPRFVDFYTYGDQGTSFAAPIVAGLITRILEDNPNYNLNEIRTILERNSKLMEFERYSDYSFPSEKTKLFVQVLDPYDLENNLTRDGRLGHSIKLFTDGITREDYTFTFDTTHRIDMHTKVDGLYEILFGRNPDQAGLDWWLENITSKGWSVSEVINRFCYSEESNWFNSDDAERTSMVPLIERVQALHHVGLSREPSLQETVQAIEYYNDIGENWNKFVADFIGYHKIEVLNLVW